MPHFDNPFGAQTELTDASAGISYRQNGERMAFAARAFCTSAGVITDGSLIFVNTLSKKFLKLRPAQPSGWVRPETVRPCSLLAGQPLERKSRACYFLRRK
jgi:hypothetical protein